MDLSQQALQFLCNDLSPEMYSNKANWLNALTRYAWSYLLRAIEYSVTNRMIEKFYKWLFPVTQICFQGNGSAQQTPYDYFTE